jgi:hypothetical protein
MMNGEKTRGYTFIAVRLLTQQSGAQPDTTVTGSVPSKIRLLRVMVTTDVPHLPPCAQAYH